jgi:O-antigen/teichoic acid export membrane protein
MVTPIVKRSSALVRYGGFFLSVGTARVLGLLITSVTFPILVRRLGVEMYGLWSYIVALCAFLEVVANPGLSTYITQQSAALRHAASELIPDFLVLRGLSSLVALIILLLIAGFEVRPEVRSLLRWYGVGALCVGLTGADFLLTSLELFHVRSLLTLIQQALYAAGILILVRTPKDIIWLPASILSSALVANLVGWLVLWRNGFRPPLAIRPGRWRSILVPSFHYAATTMMATAYHRTGHIVVRWFLGDHALGLYAAAVRFVDILRNFVNIALSVLMPRIALAAQTKAGLRRLVQAAVSALALTSIPLMLGTLATAHLVVPWVLGASYVAAVGPVRWMAGYLLAAPIASLLSGTVLYAMGKHRAYLISATVGALFAVLLSLLLVRAFGLIGVCVAFVLAELAVGVTAYLLMPHDLRDLWKNSIIAVSGFSGLLMVAAVRLANSYSSRPLLVVGVGAVVYLIASGVLGRKLLMQQFGGAG